MADGVALDRGGSLAALRQRFAAAGAPELDRIIGLHEARYLGPAWLRWGGPVGVALLGMPGWAGKRFPDTAAGPGSVTDAGTDSVRGCNVRRSGRRLVDSLPMTARVEASVTDGRPAIVATYQPEAPWPWRTVRDELRPVAPDALLGLSFGFPLLRQGMPFLLLRRG